jgi:hypothetical protein
VPFREILEDCDPLALFAFSIKSARIFFFDSATQCVEKNPVNYYRLGGDRKDLMVI